MNNLFSRFADVVAGLPATSIVNPRAEPALLLDRIEHDGRAVEMVYAPFDHVNPSARVVIIGMTPGLQQASNALRAAQAALHEGASHSVAAMDAKVFASFSGPMRTNLIAMLDSIGIASHLGVASTASLWEANSHLVHFTSALRYPVFVDGENWSGQPDMLRTEALQQWLEIYTGDELRTLSRNPLFVPLGPKVADALRHLAKRGFIAGDRILTGLPHPSGANAERIAYFLGRKERSLLSSKTNAATIDRDRAGLIARVAGL